MALVGMADIFIIGFPGESAVSGVSLVNSFNTISESCTISERMDFQNKR